MKFDSIMLIAVASAAVFSLAPISSSVRGEAGNWKYDGQPDKPLPGRAVYRTLRLTSERPSDVKELAEYRGTSQHYAQLRYGAENSTRVVVVLDELGGGTFDLYVDRNRDRSIRNSELAEGSGRTRTMPLSVEFDREGRVLRKPCLVAVRRGITGRTLGVATLGHVTGSVMLVGENPVAARRVDGDGNGLFSDSADRIWLDLDDSGTWDPFGEQFPHNPVLQLGGQRYAVRADRFGHRLSVEKIEGVGRILVELADQDAQESVLASTGMLVGDDGSAFAFQHGQAVTVPVGRYAVGSVSISLRDEHSGLPWTFVFSRFSRLDVWHEVLRDQRVTLDPVGQLRFELELDRASETCRPGATLTVKPRLCTQDGLLINASSRGETDRRTGSNHNRTSIEIRNAAGVPLMQTSSGFA